MTNFNSMHNYHIVLQFNKIISPQPIFYWFSIHPVSYKMQVIRATWQYGLTNLYPFGDCALSKGAELGESAVRLVVAHADAAVNLALLLTLQADREGDTNGMTG